MYNQTKPGLFRIPTFARWMVLPTSPELIDDVRKAPDDVLNPRKPFREVRAIDGTSTRRRISTLIVHTVGLYSQILEQRRPLSRRSDSLEIDSEHCGHV